MDNIVQEDEKIDDLEYKNFKIIQKKVGFRFGIDSVLLSDFAKDVKKNSVGVDLGTGTGILGILLCAKTEAKKIIGVEVQKDIAHMAKRSIILNNLSERFEIIHEDMKEILKFIPKASQDFVITNPPYKKVDTGLLNTNESKIISRHEVKCTIEDVIKISASVLKSEGKLYMVHRPERLADIICNLRKYSLEPKKIQFVQPKIQSKANLVLIKAIKGAKEFLSIEKNLIIYDEKNNYTHEILKIYNKI